MKNNTKQGLSPYWQRITAKAEDLLLKRIEELEARTVDPEYCLLPEDQSTMFKRQLSLSGYKDILERVKEGSLSGKLWALDTVMGYNPFLALPKP